VSSLPRVHYHMSTRGAADSSVTTSGDFDRLSAQYNSTATPTGPAKSNVTQGSVTCPAENDQFRANNTLPPTPDESVCNCIDQNAFTCRVLQTTADEPNKVGALIE